MTYVWLRDLTPIAGATGSTYTVKGQDTGHHLQCQVTATDGGGSATANSAFVTIPVGGVPRSAGETAVGKAAFKSGKLSVPIACSAQASGGCQVTLRLTVLELLSGSRVVAYRGPLDTQHPRGAASLRHVTVTLASARAHLSRGAHATLAAALDATGRRLLAVRRRLGANAYVSGTVIGVIEAGAGAARSAHSASTHAAHRQAHQAAGLALALVLAAEAGHSSCAAQPDLRERTPRHTPTPRSEERLAATPYMGWDTYFALGGALQRGDDPRAGEPADLTSVSSAVATATSGSTSAGGTGPRNANGEITVSPTQWPHGIAWLTSTLHAAGCASASTPTRAQTAAAAPARAATATTSRTSTRSRAWGFDAVKVDFCGGAE